MYLITLFLSLFLLLLSCNTLEEKKPVEKVKEIQEEVKVEKEEVHIEKLPDEKKVDNEESEPNLMHYYLVEAQYNKLIEIYNHYNGQYNTNYDQDIAKWNKETLELLEYLRGEHVENNTESALLQAYLLGFSFDSEVKNINWDIDTINIKNQGIADYYEFMKNAKNVLYSTN
jgi:hypothetical protein